VRWLSEQQVLFRRTHAKTCEATYRNFMEAGRSSRACVRTRRQIGNGGLVDEELVQGQFTLLFGEICSVYAWE